MTLEMAGYFRKMLKGSHHPESIATLKIFSDAMKKSLSFKSIFLILLALPSTTFGFLTSGQFWKQDHITSSGPIGTCFFLIFAVH